MELISTNFYKRWLFRKKKFGLHVKDELHWTYSDANEMRPKYFMLTSQIPNLVEVRFSNFRDEIRGWIRVSIMLSSTHCVQSTYKRMEVRRHGAA
jgi:hypothetical protein